MFKASLVELAQQRLKFRDDLVARYIDILLDNKELVFFRVAESSKKIKVVQINKTKFKECRTIIEQK